jgi:hypothetical protein
MSTGGWGLALCVLQFDWRLGWSCICVCSCQLSCYRPGCSCSYCCFITICIYGKRGGVGNSYLARLIAALGTTRHTLRALRTTADCCHQPVQPPRGMVRSTASTSGTSYRDSRQQAQPQHVTQAHVHTTRKRKSKTGSGRRAVTAMVVVA